MQIRISDSPNFKSEPISFSNYNKRNAYGLSIGGLTTDYSAFVPIYKRAGSDTATADSVPELGEHTLEVLTQFLGYDAAKAQQLCSSGVAHQYTQPNQN